MYLEGLCIILDILCFVTAYKESTREGIDFYAFIAAAIQCVARFAAIYGFRRIHKERRQPAAYQQQQQNMPATSQLQSYQNPIE
uniref:Uncharacterized protein n=1 Tax=Parascaris univalens TaxID=6257 RepID=A0A915BA48_PARUN